VLKRTASYHEYLDDRGQRFIVRLCEGMTAGVVQFGPISERIEWRREWGRYHPQHTATAERLVAEFERRRDPIEQINEKLALAGRQPAAAKRKRVDQHERQLPVADRA
jgi:hypothetical protein